MTREQYQQYLQTPRWKAISERVKERDGRKCKDCGARYVQLDVHHEHYGFLGREEQDGFRCLTTLCRRCHKQRHAPNYSWQELKELYDRL